MVTHERALVRSRTRLLDAVKASPAGMWSDAVVDAMGALEALVRTEQRLDLQAGIDLWKGHHDRLEAELGDANDRNDELAATAGNYGDALREWWAAADPEMPHGPEDVFGASIPLELWERTMRALGHEYCPACGGCGGCGDCARCEDRELTGGAETLNGCTNCGAGGVVPPRPVAELEPAGSSS